MYYYIFTPNWTGAEFEQFHIKQGIKIEMMQHLFVYGTLGPGRPNEHVLNDIEGTWEKASVYGYLKQEGWGAEMGYPGIINLADTGNEIKGYLFCSDRLETHWNQLDDFEGDGYKRVSTKVETKNKTTVDAYIYILRNSKSVT
jgi:gamma-glutamylcyclotransferase (GGCT)/AIG2-like uncharacterized protein YtfP